VPVFFVNPQPLTVLSVISFGIDGLFLIYASEVSSSSFQSDYTFKSPTGISTVPLSSFSIIVLFTFILFITSSLSL
jgi:hypothetical protein